MVIWSVPISNEIAHKRAGARRKLNQARRVASFGLSFEVWALARRGLTIQQIALELDIAPVTAWRHYTKWFGKRRPMIARGKVLAQRIAAAEAEIDRRFNLRREAQPVDRVKLSELLARLKVRQV
jgi:hypothetical protein